MKKCRLQAQLAFVYTKILGQKDNNIIEFLND